MQEIVPVFEQDLAGEKILAVNGQDIYDYLAPKTPFRKWMPRAIEYAKLQEGIDFIVFEVIVEREIGATAQKRYILSLDAAKEVTLMERKSTKSKALRVYLITFEKEARKKLMELANEDEESLLARALVIASRLLKEKENRLQVEQEKVKILEGKARTLVCEESLKAAQATVKEHFDITYAEAQRCIYKSYQDLFGVNLKREWQNYKKLPGKRNTPLFRFLLYNGLGDSYLQTVESLLTTTIKKAP